MLKMKTMIRPKLTVRTVRIVKTSETIRTVRTVRTSKKFNRLNLFNQYNQFNVFNRRFLPAKEKPVQGKALSRTQKKRLLLHP